MADSGANRPHVSHDDLAAGGAEGAGAQQAAASPSQAGMDLEELVLESEEDVVDDDDYEEEEDGGELDEDNSEGSWEYSDESAGSLSGPRAQPDGQADSQRGCSHYRRGCKLVAPCCGEAFWCRFCHDSVKDVTNGGVVGHKLNRHAVAEVICCTCELRQPVSQHCTGCDNKFGEYFCSICNFFDDDLTKAPFHCHGCGICRVGGRERFFHCDTCGCCYTMELQGNHRCIQGSMHQNCPVCQEDLFNSTSECRVLACGHTMHNECLRHLVRASRLPRCPLCSVTILDSSLTWAQLDEEIARTPMPPDYAGMKVMALCNDCHHRGETDFHVLGLKCAHPSCGGYNTRQL